MVLVDLLKVIHELADFCGVQRQELDRVLDRGIVVHVTLVLGNLRFLETFPQVGLHVLQVIVLRRPLCKLAHFFQFVQNVLCVLNLRHRRSLHPLEPNVHIAKPKHGHVLFELLPAVPEKVFLLGARVRHFDLGDGM